MSEPLDTGPCKPGRGIMIERVERREGMTESTPKTPVERLGEDRASRTEEKKRPGGAVRNPAEEDMGQSDGSHGHKMRAAGKGLGNGEELGPSLDKSRDGKEGGNPEVGCDAM